MSKTMWTKIFVFNMPFSRKKFSTSADTDIFHICVTCGKPALQDFAFIFDVISLTVTAISLSVFSRSSILRTDESTVV